MYKLYGHKHARVNKRVYRYLFACLNCSLAFPVYSTTVAAVYADFINPLIVLPDENSPVDESTAATFFGGHVKYLPAADGTPTEVNDGVIWLAESAFGQIAATTFSLPIYTITPSANPPAGGSFTPSGAQTTTLGATKTFTVAANNGYTRSNTVNGTCPQGTWNGGSTGSPSAWTTGAITANCTVIFNFTGGPQLPTCSTVAASNVTINSATLNGSVVSPGATATASFDFGFTTAYGQSITATPAQVYSSTAVTVAANKTGLTCGTAYHFRCKAISSTGTGLGADQSFTTLATCSPVAWMYPPNSTVLINKPLALDIHVNSNGDTVGVYEFTVNFDKDKLQVNTNYQNVVGQCDQGICPGSGALSSNIVAIDNVNGVIKLSGFDTNGQGPSNDLQLLVINFTAKPITGLTQVRLTTTELTNTDGVSLGNTATGTTVTVSPCLCGDADGKGEINIVDALAISRYVVGLPPPPTVNVNCADVNRSTTATTVDALFIAKYSVGLPPVTGTCAIGLPL